MNYNRQVLTSSGDNIQHSFCDRLYQRLEEALQAGTEVSLRLTWGGFTGIPIYLDSDCVEIVYVHVSDLYEDDNPSEDISWRTVWLVHLEEISAISYLSESWSKGQFEQLLGPAGEASEKERKK